MVSIHQVLFKLSTTEIDEKVKKKAFINMKIKMRKLRVRMDLENFDEGKEKYNSTMSKEAN